MPLFFNLCGATRLAAKKNRQDGSAVLACEIMIDVSRHTAKTGYDVDHGLGTADGKNMQCNASVWRRVPTMQ